MFDDKKQPDDMFAGTEDAAPMQPAPAPSALLTPPPIAQQTSQGEAPSDSPIAGGESQPERHRFGFAKVILVVIVVLALVAGAAYAAYTIMVSKSTTDSVVKSVSDEGVVAEDEEGKNDAASSRGDEGSKTETDATNEDKETLFDSDGDGLNNAEELDAGTLSNNPDTDSDGLGDREEVKVYGTDPRDSDTDGDTFLDGQEVAGGFNPNGEGKLFNVPSNQ